MGGPKTMDDSAREALVRLTNESGRRLRLKDKGTVHGIFLSDPPGEIAMGATGEWKTGSDGTPTGTEAWVQYQSAEGIVYCAHWPQDW